MVAVRLAFGASASGGALSECSGNSCQEDESELHIELGRMEDRKRQQQVRDAFLSCVLRLKLGGERG
jgi:hypothetical protein